MSFEVKFRNIILNTAARTRTMGPVESVFLTNPPTPAWCSDFELHAIEFNSVPGLPVTGVAFVDLPFVWPAV